MEFRFYQKPDNTMRSHSQFYRKCVQFGFLSVTIWIGIEFIIFVYQLENGLNIIRGEAIICSQGFKQVMVSLSKCVQGLKKYQTKDHKYYSTPHSQGLN